MRYSAALALLTSLAFVPAADAAAPDCSDTPPTSRILASGQGTLESIIVHPNGKLYFSTNEGLLRLDSPTATPELHTPVEEPGGLAVEPDGTIVMGSGNSIANGQVGDQTGPSSLIKIDPVTGESEPFASNLSMGNGVDRGPDGYFYASNDFGSNIDRISPDGETERGWANVESGNGLVVDSTGKWLYVAQTFRPAAIQRIELANQENVTPFAVAPTDDASAGFDGMDRDDADNLFVAANGAGSVWKVTRDAEMCVLLRGLPPFPDGPSAVSVGVRGSEFPPENLYVVAFNGDLTEIDNVATVAPEPALKLSVKPRSPRAGRRVTFRFKVTGDGKPAFGAVVHFLGQRVSANRDGRVRIRKTFKRRGRHTATATQPGFKRAKVVVRVRKR